MKRRNFFTTLAGLFGGLVLPWPAMAGASKPSSHEAARQYMEATVENIMEKTAREVWEGAYIHS